MNVFITGDTHNDLTDTKTRLEDWFNRETVEKENTTLIILGDFGGNIFTNTVYEKYNIDFKKMLESFNINYFVIRGNHDQRPSNLFNSEKWHFEQFFNGPVYVENDFPHIKYAMDYPWVYTINDKKTLVLPGGYSVDKELLLQNEKDFGIKKWFYDEQMTTAEQEYIWQLCNLNNYQFDVILSHICPYKYLPIKVPEFIVTNDYKTMEKLFDEIDDKVTYRSWFWGHHHFEQFREENGHLNCCFYDSIDNFDALLKAESASEYLSKNSIFNLLPWLEEDIEK